MHRKALAGVPLWSIALPVSVGVARASFGELMVSLFAVFLFLAVVP